jgi:catechol 2,3-dioxygenase-like lactoylglutathione lyase family enzyme
MVSFFTDVLGFRVSDRMATDAYVWMRCNAYHHSIGFIKGQLGLHHYAWEVRDFADYRRLGDHLRGHDRGLLWGVGRHGPGHNIFAYFHDEDEAVVEYSGDLQRITDESSYRAGNWPMDPATGTVWGGLAPSLDHFLGLGVDSAIGLPGQQRQAKPQLAQL